MTKNNELFTTMPVGKAVAKLCIPTVISQIIVILYSLADTFFIGQIGDPNQLAALSITFPIYTLLTAVANLFGIGANSVISRSLGQNDESSAQKASSFGFLGSVVFTALLAIILAIFMNPILSFFGADGDTLGYTSDYLLWVFVIGGIPTTAGLVLGHLVRSVGKTKEAGIGLTIGGIMNMLLDPVFIFLFDMDVVGAAVATMISNTISMLYFFVVLFRVRNSSILTISPKHFSWEKKVSFGTISVGFPAAIAVLLVSVSISLLNGLLLKHEGGNILSAAYGVTSKVGTIALHISIGIAQGVMPIIGYNYGAKNHKRVHEVCRLSFIILWIFSIIFLAIVQLMPSAIIRAFTPNPETIEIGSEFIRRWSWCIIGMSLFNMYNSIFQAVGRWKTSLLLAVLRLGVIFSILCLVMDVLFGVTGLMWVQSITDTLSFIIAAIMYARFKKSVVKEVAETAKMPVPQRTSARIITISHEYGSCGRLIGEGIAEKLSIPCYDSDFIDRTAAETGLSKEYIEKYGEDALSDSFYGNVIAVRDNNGQTASDKIWLAQRKAITELASKGPCVIVGRCAEFILQDIADCLTVFIHAADEKRMEKLISDYGKQQDISVKMLHDKDKKRRAYYELYTGFDWGVVENYNLCLDSGKLGIDNCVSIIANIYKNM